MIIKNEIPILEFDNVTSAVIMPTHENLNLQLPEKAVFAFLSDYIDEYANANNAKQVGTFESATKNYPIYVLDYEKEKICLVQAPVGAAPATQIMDWLIGYGVRKIISGGCCGALKDYPEGTFLVPSKALRDEGTSYHYAPPSRFIDINKNALKAIESTIEENGLSYQEVITWSTDGFYRETKEKVEYRRSEGCSVVEMECSALAACAQFRNVVFGQILYTADTLCNLEKWDARNWGKNSTEYALKLCLDSVLKI
jgi:uridine phosphorylase